MHPAPDVLYRIHQFQAARRGHLPLAFSAFQARLPATYETVYCQKTLPSAKLVNHAASR